MQWMPAHLKLMRPSKHIYVPKPLITQTCSQGSRLVTTTAAVLVCGLVLVVVAAVPARPLVPVAQAAPQPVLLLALQPAQVVVVEVAVRVAPPRAPAHVPAAALVDVVGLVPAGARVTVVGRGLDKGVANDFVENHSGSCGGARGVH